MPSHRGSLATAIAEHAVRHPDATALVWRGAELSYGDLYAQACRERARVDALGLAEGELLAVVAPKSAETVALLLGSLLAGRHVLLPSPALPDATLEALLSDAGCRHVLAPGVAAWGAESEAAAGAPPVRGGGAFVLTTSGSTGPPKVVPLAEGGIARFTAWAAERFAIGRRTTVLNYAPLNFDLCLLDVWTSLAHGARVVLVDPDRATSGRYLLDLLGSHDVQVVQGVPILYGLVADAAASDARLEAVEHVIVTGDAIARRTLAELPRLFPKARLYNLYGCTETNDSFLHEIDAASVPSGPVPLGEPLPGVGALVVDDAGDVVTGEGTGELYVRTPFQASGYLDPERTAARFVDHPAGADDHRWYRTGDVVRREADGRLLLQGRLDFQVKVRGVAVNTAEVERVLCQHPDVVEAAVIAVPDALVGRYLLAVVRRAPGSRLTSLTLLPHSRAHLPSAAVPSVRIVDDPLPKGSTGKVDRSALERAFAAPPDRSPRKED